MQHIEWLIPLVAVAVIAVLTYTINGKTRRRCVALQQRGIHANRRIKQLLVDMQQHRGMANAVLNGDQSFLPRLEKKRAELDRDIAALDSSPERELMVPGRWDEIKDGWRKLHDEVLNLNQEDSFRQHSALIRAILYTMGDVAERSQLTGTCAISPALVNALWSDLPTVAECLGQARGLGAGVAAKGYCSSVSRIKLRFLEARIGETMDWVSKDLSGPALPKNFNTEIVQLWENTVGSMREFLALLEQSLIQSEHPSIKADRYFDSATKELDAVFDVFDQACSALEQPVS